MATPGYDQMQQSFASMNIKPIQPLTVKKAATTPVIDPDSFALPDCFGLPPASVTPFQQHSPYIAPSALPVKQTRHVAHHSSVQSVSSVASGQSRMEATTPLTTPGTVGSPLCHSSTAPVTGSILGGSTMVTSMLAANTMPASNTIPVSNAMPNANKMPLTSTMPVANTIPATNMAPIANTMPVGHTGPACQHCRNAILPNIAIFLCLVCSSANIVSQYCGWCCTGANGAISHPHDSTYWVTESDVHIELGQTTVPTQHWAVRQGANGRIWYTHKMTGYKTYVAPVSVEMLGSSGLPPGWQERQTTEGQTYYFNSTTSSSSWEKPASTMPGGWKELKTPDMVSFYVNETLGVSMWDRPGDQPKPRPVAAQAQAVVATAPQQQGQPPKQRKASTKGVSANTNVASPTGTAGANQSQMSSALLSATKAATAVATKHVGKLGSKKNLKKMGKLAFKVGKMGLTDNYDLNFDLGGSSDSGGDDGLDLGDSSDSDVGDFLDGNFVDGILGIDGNGQQQQQAGAKQRPATKHPQKRPAKKTSRPVSQQQATPQQNQLQGTVQMLQQLVAQPHVLTHAQTFPQMNQQVAQPQYPVLQQQTQQGQVQQPVYQQQQVVNQQPVFQQTMQQGQMMQPQPLALQSQQLPMQGQQQPQNQAVYQHAVPQKQSINQPLAQQPVQQFHPQQPAAQIRQMGYNQQPAQTQQLIPYQSATNGATQGYQAVAQHPPVQQSGGNQGYQSSVNNSAQHDRQIHSHGGHQHQQHQHHQQHHHEHQHHENHEQQDYTQTDQQSQYQDTSVQDPNFQQQIDQQQYQTPDQQIYQPQPYDPNQQFTVQLTYQDPYGNPTSGSSQPTDPSQQNAQTQGYAADPNQQQYVYNPASSNQSQDATQGQQGQVQQDPYYQQNNFSTVDDSGYTYQTDNTQYADPQVDATASSYDDAYDAYDTGYGFGAVSGPLDDSQDYYDPGPDPEGLAEAFDCQDAGNFG